MCLAIPGRIVEFVPDQPHLARVDVAGVKRKVNIGLLEGEEVRLGDWVLIHVGFALSKVSETAAQDQLRMLAALGEDEKAIEEVRGYMFAEPGEAS
jgi:hydrogenase expression/formation protein HypC